MYCPGCRYSLCGQVEPRCPECGRPFDFSDDSTFDTELPGVLRRAHRWLAPHRFKILVGLMAITIVVWWATAADFPRPFRPSIASMSTVQLKGILTEWAIQQHDGRAGDAFSRKQAVQNIRGDYSPVHDYPKAQLRSALERWVRSGYVFVHLLPLAACLTAVAVFWRGKVRRLGVVMLMIVLLPIGDTVVDSLLLRTLLSGSHTFLDDFVFLTNVDLTSTSSQRWSTIAAYERKPPLGNRKRLVGFADGHVERVWEEEFTELLRLQGYEIVEGTQGVNPIIPFR